MTHRYRVALLCASLFALTSCPLDRAPLPTQQSRGGAGALGSGGQAFLNDQGPLLVGQAALAEVVTQPLAGQEAPDPVTATDSMADDVIPQAAQAATGEDSPTAPPEDQPEDQQVMAEPTASPGDPDPVQEDGMASTPEAAETTNGEAAMAATSETDDTEAEALSPAAPMSEPASEEEDEVSEEDEQYDEYDYAEDEQEDDSDRRGRQDSAGAWIEELTCAPPSALCTQGRGVCCEGSCRPFKGADRCVAKCKADSDCQSGCCSKATGKWMCAPAEQCVIDSLINAAGL